MSAPSANFNWLKSISRDLLALDEIPLLGHAPVFHWDQLSSYLSKVFSIEDLSIQPGQIQWRSANELTQGLPADTRSWHLQVAPLAGSLWFLLGNTDTALIMSLLLTQKAEIYHDLDSEFFNSFSQFLALEILHGIEQIDFDKGLTPQLVSDEHPPTEDGLCQELTIRLLGKEFQGRLILSAPFREAWKTRYAAPSANALHTSDLAQKVMTTIHLEVTKIQMPLSEWKTIQIGDFLLLDHCSYEPGSDKNRLFITFQGRPLFRAKIKEGDVKVLEYPQLHEMEIAMPKQPSDDFDEDDESLNFDEDDDDLDFDEDDEDFDFEEGDEDFEDEEFEEEEEEEELSTPTRTEARREPEAAPVVEEKTQEAQPKESAPQKIEDVPLQISIELAQIQISIQKLLEMQPGNLLELSISPDSPVTLVTNGTPIGKGELLKIGDVLGIRILELG